MSPARSVIPCLLLGVLAAGLALAVDRPDDKKKPEGRPAKTVKIGKIHFYVNYDEAMTVARKKGKPLWLHFGENPG